jgi:hypothetical protein
VVTGACLPMCRYRSDGPTKKAEERNTWGCIPMYCVQPLVDHCLGVKGTDAALSRNLPVGTAPAGHEPEVHMVQSRTVLPGCDMYMLLEYINYCPTAMFCNGSGSLQSDSCFVATAREFKS